MFKFEKLKSLAVGLCCICPVQLMADPVANTNATRVIDAQPVELFYVIINQAASDVLAAVSRDSGVRISGVDGLRGRASNMILAGDVHEIVEAISQANDFDWFEYNGVIHVSAKSDSVTRIIRLGDLSVQDALSELASNGLLLDRFPITPTSENSALSITGSPYMVALSESIIEGMPSEIKTPRQAEFKTLIVRRALEVEHVQFRQ